MQKCWTLKILSSLRFEKTLVQTSILCYELIKYILFPLMATRTSDDVPAGMVTLDQV